MIPPELPGKPILPTVDPPATARDPKVAAPLVVNEPNTPALLVSKDVQVSEPDTDIGVPTTTSPEANVMIAPELPGKAIEPNVATPPAEIEPPT
jgi:hypothetical protein